MKFEWDADKAKVNFRKHGVTFEEATTVFSDPFAISLPDDRHSQTEQRYFIIGASSQDRLVVVFHTDRNDNIRIISARRATSRERKQYEEI